MPCRGRGFPRRFALALQYAHGFPHPELGTLCRGGPRHGRYPVRTVSGLSGVAARALAGLCPRTAAEPGQTAQSQSYQRADSDAARATAGEVGLGASAAPPGGYRCPRRCISPGKNSFRSVTYREEPATQADCRRVPAEAAGSAAEPLPRGRRARQQAVHVLGARPDSGKLQLRTGRWSVQPQVYQGAS